MSDYLIREINAAPNVDVRYGVEVVGGGGAAGWSTCGCGTGSPGPWTRFPRPGCSS
jgi:hypothetical protein